MTKSRFNELEVNDVVFYGVERSLWRVAKKINDADELSNMRWSKDVTCVIYLEREPTANCHCTSSWVSDRNCDGFSVVPPDVKDKFLTLFDNEQDPNRGVGN